MTTYDEQIITFINNMNASDDLKIGYLILAHTDAPQLGKLVNTVDYKSRIFIHLDKKSNINAFKDINLPKSAEFIWDRVPVYWGGISMVKATLNLIKAALSSGEKFSHLVLLSGSDYPIKSAHSIYDFLTQNSQRQFIRFIDMAMSPNPGMQRVLQYWYLEPFLPFEDKLIRTSLQKVLNFSTRRKPFKDLRLAFGSQWWAITPECAAFILQFVEQNLEFLNFYKYAHCPDEHFFHTIVANSPFLEAAGGFQEGIKWPHEVSNLTLNFEGRVLAEEDYGFLEDLHLNREPTKQRMSQELDALMGTSITRGAFNYSSFFFARKFTTKRSSKLLDLIDENLLSRSCV
ncbi:MAG: beta-1,6-N-acetylglucosaminyltransferase [Elainellaceae cyanobacterium]